MLPSRYIFVLYKPLVNNIEALLSKEVFSSIADIDSESVSLSELSLPDRLLSDRPLSDRSLSGHYHGFHFDNLNRSSNYQ